MQGWRKTNEDTHGVYNLQIGGSCATLVYVFDGHGGDFIANEAKRRISSLLSSNLSSQNINNPKTIGFKIQETFLLLDKALYTEFPQETSGCTAIVAVLTEKNIIVANAGDSRGILMQGDNTVKEMSFDHKPNTPEEKARITAAGGGVKYQDHAWRINSVLAVSRGFGDFRFKEYEFEPDPKKYMVSAYPDINIFTRDGQNKEQFLLLCCDGIWDKMSNEEAGVFVKNAIEWKYQGEDISKVTERLLDKCLDKGSTDNMTAVVVVNPEAITPGELKKPVEVQSAEKTKAV